MEQKVALVVGINKYLKPGFPNLNYAEKDAIALGGELRKLGFRVVVMTGSADGKLKATRQNIDDQVNTLVRPLTKDDVALVALSGHGQQLQVTGADGKPKDDSFFCPLDAVKNDKDTLFSLSYLIDEVLARNVGRKLVLVDACRNVPKDPSRGAKGIQGKVYALPEDTAVLFSCRAGQESFESDELQHGVFTSCVLDGLRGAAARDRQVSWSDLVAHVNRRMASSEIKRFVPSGRRQVPIPAGGVPFTVLGELGGFAGSKAGQEWDGNGLKMKFCWCPAGTFTMGSPESEVGRSSSEAQVRVTLSQGFWLGCCEARLRNWMSSS
ncbi:MAG: caspase family protein [Planctomycetota bacterium]|nr:caspase family protein [Planctomycetota bacterium]